MREAALVFALLLPLAVLARDLDHDDARRLVEQGRILPLSKVLETVAAHRPGRVIEVELEDEDGALIYEVEVLDQHGSVWEVQLDATTGKLIRPPYRD